MTSSAATISKRSPLAAVSETPARVLLLAAHRRVLAGMAAEVDSALRVPLLLMVGFGASARYAVTRAARPAPVSHGCRRRRHRAAETVYAIIHVAAGERFHAERFGPQWSQAIGLIAAHGLFLGVPTGIAAAFMLQARPFVRMRRDT
jgi:hypothetical protein